MLCPNCNREHPETQPCEYQTTPVGVCAINPVVASIKTLGRSTQFLLVCIFQSLTALCSLVATFLNPFIISQNSDIQTTTFNGNFIVPTLMALAFWLIYATCRSDASPFLKTGGLTIIKVIQTILLVCLYILVALIPLILIGLFALSAMGEEFWNQFINEFMYEFGNQMPSEFHQYFESQFLMNSLTVVTIVVMLVCLGVLIFNIVVTSLTVKGLNILKENFEGILTDRSFPLLVIVMGYISAIGSYFTTVSGLITLDVFTLLESAFTATATLLGCMLVQKHRKGMAELRTLSRMATTDSSVAPTPQPQPFQAPAAPYIPITEQPSTDCLPVEETVPLTVEETLFEEAISQPEETEEPLETETEIPQPTEIEIPKTPKYCSVCGTPLQDYAHFCHNCGHSTKE
jgi:hypothetical protein